MRRLLLFTILLYSGSGLWVHLYGQEMCGADRLLAQRIQSLGLTYEQYIEQVEQKMKNTNAKHRLQSAQIYYIPVVMHVLHFGEEVGRRFNISKAIIDEQMEVLNKAFAEAHEHVGHIAAEFVDDKAGDAKIQFMLANKDPQGNPTEGITRTEVPSQGTVFFKNMPSLKSPWDQAKYLNIWILPKRKRGNDWIGVAEFPPHDETDRRNRDGVAMITESFPGISRRHQGRILVHEIGHYLGLYHTWGRKGGCWQDDMCPDTPLQANPLYESSCSRARRSCDMRSMTENYMSYSTGTCMLMFTQCQRDRMRNVLASNRHRNTLWQNAIDRIPHPVPLQVPSAMSYAEVRMYPNPALERIHFTGLAAAKSYPYKIYTATGLLMRSGVLHKSDAIDINKLSRGQYIVVLYTKAGAEVLHSSLIVK